MSLMKFGPNSTFLDLEEINKEIDEEFNSLIDSKNFKKKYVLKDCIKNLYDLFIDNPHSYRDA